MDFSLDIISEEGGIDLLRNVSEIKGIVFHISELPLLSTDDWRDIQKIYESEFNCLFLTDLEGLPGFIDESDIIKVETVKMVLLALIISF